MTTEATLERRSPLDRNALLVVPAVLAVALATLPLLSRDVAGSLLTQIVIVLILILGGIDFLSLKIPNVLVYPAIAFVLGGTALVEVALLDQALLGGAVTLGVMFILALAGRGTLGMGDVKFGCLVGCALGWRLGLMALGSGFVFGAVLALALLVRGLRTRKDVVPLSPFLAASAVVWLLLEGALVS